MNDSHAGGGASRPAARGARPAADASRSAGDGSGRVTEGTAPATRAVARSDDAARRRIREDLATTFVVEAAAGTGKTTELVRRIVGAIRTGAARLESIAAMTFTEKAAGELKLRLRAEIERARSEPTATPIERDRLGAALAELEVASIGTIHSFCADLLRERPVEAGVDPAFGVLGSDADVDRLLVRAFDAWFQRALEDPPEGLRRVLRRRAWARGDGPRGQLLRACRDLLEHRDCDAPWRRELRVGERERAIDAMIGDLARLGALAGAARHRGDYLAQNLADIAAFVAELEAREAVAAGGRDYDGLEGALRELARAKSWSYRGYGRAFGESLLREAVIAERDAVRARLDQLLARVDADLAAALRADLAAVIDAYEELKRKAGVLDFLDLLLRTRDLLREGRGVREQLAARFSHLFVDEFQDTDPLQAEILLLLAAADPSEADPWRARTVPGKLFVVGDPKQSIYRFRRADVALYERVKRHLLATGAELLHLTASFRAVPAIQAVVNASFEPEMRGDEEGLQAAYVPLEPVREQTVGRPSVIALAVPRPYGRSPRPTAQAIDESAAEAVPAFIEWLLRESGWTVTEQRGGVVTEVPVEPRHVCLLFRQFQSYGRDRTRPYVRGLEARRIPHVLVGGRSLHDREEIVALRSALAAIEWPDDELAVYATLRGPLLAFTDDVLLAARHVMGHLSPLRAHAARTAAASFAPAAGEAGGAPSGKGGAAGSASAFDEVTDALVLLAKLHLERNRRPVASTIAGLLEATRGHATIANWPTGEQALSNVLRVMDLARRWEAQGATSFRAFVEWLDDQAERGEGAEAPIVEETSEGVRIMTVHAAKGLELPVVVLCDPAGGRSQRGPSRWVDAEKRLWAAPLAGCAPAELLDRAEAVERADAAEEVRVAYVAATRARDLLVVPAVGDDRMGGWTRELHKAIYPGEGSGRPVPAPGCPRFGSDTVLHRPDGAMPTTTVVPGLHPRLAGGYGVVWWDPATLPLEAPPPTGVRRRELLVASAPVDKAGATGGAAAGAPGGAAGGATEGADAQGLRAHAAWREARKEAIERAAVPSVTARPVTTVARALAESETEAERSALEPVRIERTSAIRANRPRGRRFGTLVHAVLATIPFDADEAALAALVGVNARLLGATPEEEAAAREAVAAALAHPLLARAIASANCRREAPIVMRLPDGSLVEGAIDLAFREAGPGGARWFVVDFKTDEDPAAEPAYAAQVRLYVEAVRAATGELAEGALLAV